MTVITNQVHRPKVASKILDVSESTLWRMVQQGKLKKPIKISSRSVGFLASDLQDFINSKIKERDNDK